MAFLVYYAYEYLNNLILVKRDIYSREILLL